jgi:hypothetical protein
VEEAEDTEEEMLAPVSSVEMKNRSLTPSAKGAGGFPSFVRASDMTGTGWGTGDDGFN